MTPAEADQRIILSRTTLHRYRQMVEVLQWPLDDLPLFQKEIAVLEGIGIEHPGKIEKIMRLVVDWCALQEQVRKQLH